jgi:hypothetical protein
MNLKTTLSLVVLILAVAGLFWTGAALPPASNASVQGLPAISESTLRKITVRKGDQNIVLERTPQGDWVMPGNWPTRGPEVRQLVTLLVNLHSRFVPLSLDQDRLAFILSSAVGQAGGRAPLWLVGWIAERRLKNEKAVGLGLDRPLVTVVLTTDQGEHTLHFDENPFDEASNRFERPTFVRVDERPEVFRLGSGVAAALDRPADYYQRRQLFPSKRVVRTEGTDKVDRLSGKAVEALAQGEKRFVLAHVGDQWEMSYPLRDRLDPRTRDSLLEAVPDLWAERFVPHEPTADVAGWGWALLGLPSNPGELAVAVFWGQNQTMGIYGLLDPNRKLIVTRPDGGRITLEIGQPILAATPKNRAYARLENFNRVFEINTDKLNNIFVPAETLRDEQVARFKTDDVRKVEISHDGKTVVLQNETPRDRPENDPPPPPKWKMLQPTEASADGDLVRDLVSKLSGLASKDKDVLEKEKARLVAGAVGLAGLGETAALTAPALADLHRAESDLGLKAPAAVVTLWIEEKVKDEQDKYTTRTVRLTLGRRDLAVKKLFVRTDDWPRIDEVDDSIADLVLDKRALDYRGKKLLEFSASDITRLTVRRLDLAALSAGPLTLLGAPTGPALLAAVAATAADQTGIVVLQQDRGEWKLTAPIVHEADGVKVRDLGERLGRLEVLQFVAGSATPAELGEEYGLAVPELSVTAEFKDKPARTIDVGRSRLIQLGYFARLEGAPEVFALPDDVVKLLERDSLAYRPTGLWQLASKDDITALRIHKAGQEEYRLTRKGEEWEVSGPFTVAAPKPVVEKLATALTAPRCETYKSNDATDLKAFGLDKPEVRVTVSAKDGKEHTLLVGALAPQGGRFGRLGSGGGVFVISAALAKTADQSALDFLDRSLWKVDPGAVTLFRRQHGAAALELEKKDDTWKLNRPVEQPADERKVPELMQKLADLHAVRIAAYQPKDLAPFGLDKPEATVAIKVEGDKPTEYVLDVGKVAQEGREERFALVKGSPKVGVLSGEVVKALLAGPLAYVDHQLARFSDADKLQMESGQRKATLRRLEGTWKMTEPISAPVEHDALEGFLDGLYRLRADELVAEKPSEDDLKRYGLDRPLVKWKISNGDKEELELAIGAAEKPGGRRHARVGGKSLVVLLDARVSAGAVAEYRPHGLWKEPIDPAQIEAVRFGYRSDPFELRKGEDGNWQVVGKPEVKLDPMRVTDTLSVLRDLKLERYVNDKGDDLGLYGLKPAELTLEVTTPAGKRVLFLGGMEGGSKRRYAMLPDAEHTGVFVLDESASSRLFRNLVELGRRMD